VTEPTTSTTTGVWSAEVIAAAKAEGRAEQRAADIAALRDSQRCARYLSDRAAMKIAADYLESLGVSPTEEASG
jgi:hypothetical protein